LDFLGVSVSFGGTSLDFGSLGCSFDTFDSDFFGSFSEVLGAFGGVCSLFTFDAFFGVSFSDGRFSLGFGSFSFLDFFSLESDFDMIGNSSSFLFGF